MRDFIGTLAAKMLEPVGILQALADSIAAYQAPGFERDRAQSVAALEVVCRHLVELTGLTVSAIAADFGIGIDDMPDAERLMADTLSNGRATVAYALTQAKAEDSAALDSEFDLDAFLESIGMLAAADEDVPDAERIAHLGDADDDTNGIDPRYQGR